MQGFDGSQPISADVSWTDGLTELRNPQATTYGLLADVPAEGGTLRFFVPWTSVTFLQQFIPDGPPASQPVVGETTPAHPTGDEQQ